MAEYLGCSLPSACSMHLLIETIGVWLTGVFGFEFRLDERISGAKLQFRESRDRIRLVARMLLWLLSVWKADGKQMDSWFHCR